MGGHEVTDTFRVLVTGSRTWDDRTAVWTALDQIAVEHPSARVIVVHGDASGADRLAVEWVDNVRAEDEPHPPDYTAHGAIAPLVRNGEMVEAGADLCLTFIQECPCPRRKKPHGTHGSVDCATKAARAGIPVRHVRPAMEATR
jgi:hypothetical protein